MGSDQTEGLRIRCGTSLVSEKALGLSPSLGKRLVGFLLAF